MMFPIFAMMLLVLSAFRAVLAGRAGRFERKYTRAAVAAEETARSLQTKPGTSSQPDPYTQAKRQYELGRLVENRDKLESVYLTWEARAERVAHKLRNLRNWKGRSVPYLIGLIDAGMIAVLLWKFGVTPEMIETFIHAFIENVQK